MTTILIMVLGCGLEAIPVRPREKVSLEGRGSGSPEDSDFDQDEDGLTDGEELEWGTDVLVPDTDADGFDDGEEVEGGTHPANAFSHPYRGGYNVGDCAEVPQGASPPPFGYENGDLVANFTLLDQHGEQVDLYSFCGRTVVLAFGAPWCSACQTVAADAQAQQDHWAAQGVQIVELLIQDHAGGPVERPDLVGWAKGHGLETVPVLAVPQQGDPWLWFEKDWGIPTAVVLGPDLRVLSVDEGRFDPAPFLQ